ncbi:MAG TPA: phenylacetic acid degradation operon negative regulatory protein PaaX [Telluria sp.]
MKQISTSEWIAQFLASDPPRSKSMVMTVLGDTVAAHGGGVWLGSLIELVAPLGITERLVRTSVFRLAQEGWLAASREGRRSRYAFEPKSLARFERANRRIYAHPGLHWDGRWTLVLAPNNSIDSALRGALRKELEWEGFAMLGPGLMVHPAADPGTLNDVLTRVGGVGKVYACSADQLPGVASRPLPELVQDGWALDKVSAAYGHFIAQFAPLKALLDQDRTLTRHEAYAIRTLLIHAYRRVQLHDPMLPIELLPDPWPGTDAFLLAGAIYRLTYAQAELHVMEVMRREDEAAPEADAAFYARFGGLRPVQ